MTLLKLISYAPSIAGILIVAIVVVARNRTRKLVYFSLVSIFISLWLSAQYITELTTGSISLGALRIGSIFPNFIVLFFLFFAYEQAGLKLKTLYKLIAIAVMVLITPLSLTSLIISDVTHKGQSFSTTAGVLYNFQTAILLVYLIAGIVVLVHATKSRRDPATVAQNRVLALGVLIPIVVNAIINSLLLSVPAAQAFGPLSFLAMISIVSYAIVKHRLFDVRAAVARLITYILAFGILVALYATVVFGFGSFTSIGADLTVSQRLFYIGVALLFAVTLPSLRRTFDKLTNRIFYQDAYDPQEFISELNKTIVSDIHLKKLLEECSEVIISHLKVGFCIFGLKETESLPIRIIGKTPADFKRKDIEIVRRLTPHIPKKVILADELESDDQELKDELSLYNIGALVRLTTNVTSGKEGIGYIALGYKKSGSIFNSVDVKTLEIVANELVIAIQNAMQFEEIQQFNITLQQKVDEATSELKKTNRKLLALDEAKDEFISMASHQLRTPLTSVKGFISMMMDGDFGKVTARQHDILKEAFSSSQRMVYLIADFLNVSRLKTGKFIIEPAEVHLARMVSEEIDQLRDMAASRKLTIEYEPPVDFPVVKLDENKTRQVMMNFVDNAIYYTPSGGKIRIELYVDGKDVVFKVVDNGIGVPKSVQHRLFTKFFRAKNAQKARPDGTGLGIFMAQKIIAAQGGTVIFESVEGKGSTFGFSFPLGKVQVESKEK